MDQAAIVGCNEGCNNLGAPLQFGPAHPRQISPHEKVSVDLLFDKPDEALKAFVAGMASSTGSAKPQIKLKQVINSPPPAIRTTGGLFVAM